MFQNWEPFKGKFQDQDGGDHGDEVHVLFALCSVARHHEAMGTRESAAWSLGKWSSLIATILYLPSSGENDSQLCNLGGAICKILS